MKNAGTIQASRGCINEFAEGDVIVDRRRRGNYPTDERAPRSARVKHERQQEGVGIEAAVQRVRSRRVANGNAEIK